MSNLLTILILILFWAIGFFAYHLGLVIHILLALALIIVVLKIVQERRGRRKLQGKLF